MLALACMYIATVYATIKSQVMLRTKLSIACVKLKLLYHRAE